MADDSAKVLKLHIKFLIVIASRLNLLLSVTSSKFPRASDEIHCTCDLYLYLLKRSETMACDPTVLFKLLRLVCSRLKLKVASILFSSLASARAVS